FNDGGTQISKLVASIKNAAGLKVEGDIQYKGQYIEELARDLKPQLDRPEQEIGEQATQLIFERFIKPAIAKMGVHFDVWFNEKDLMSSGQQAKAFDRLRRENLLYEQDGALWLRSSSYGDDKDRVLVKSNGDPTYLGNDIAYHLNIFEQRNFDIAFKIWGADHMANVASLGLTVKKLLPDKQLVFVINQFVRLVRDGQEYRISKRAGTYVTVEELIDEISSDVARFFFLMRSADSHMDFDLDLAKQQSQKNPYWYVMYAYVRANSILSQAEKQGLKAAAETRRLNDLERQLVKQMARFPGLLREIAGDYGVHRLTFYGLELSRTFHDYYESERIIDLKANEASQKLYLIQQYLQFMRIFFDLLGITPIKKM
ncbi:MAG TPA: arginine--tRNA ligase, partial [Candidatus Saccharimonadales bacterium]|nr:arginine--tRNA ligase [Candidatus Saccharimonadales bacterium]